MCINGFGQFLVQIGKESHGNHFTLTRNHQT